MTACNLHAASLGGRLVRANNFSVLELHTIGFLRKTEAGNARMGAGSWEHQSSIGLSWFGWRLAWVRLKLPDGFRLPAARLSSKSLRPTPWPHVSQDAP